MTRSRAARCLIAAVSLVMLLAACSSLRPVPVPAISPAPVTPSVATPSGDGVLRVGTLFPTTGASSFLAAGQTAGVAAAVKRINALGGVGGKPVEIVAVDSGEAKAGTLETSFVTLVSKKVDVIIGPSSSALAERSIPLAIDAEIPVISPAATFSSITDAFDGGYFFRTIPAYDQQAYALAEAIAGRDPTVRIAYVYVADEEGVLLHNSVVTALADYEITLVAEEVFSSSTSDFTKIIAELKKAKPDVVVLGSTYDSVKATKAVIGKIVAAGYSGSKLWLSSLNTGDYSQSFPKGTLTGVRGIIDGAEPSKSFIKTLKETNAKLGGYRYAMEAYDATVLAALAAIVAQDDGGQAIAGALYDVSKSGVKCLSFAECLEVLALNQDIDYDGVSGPVNFTPDGNVEPGFWGSYTYNAENKFVFTSGAIVGG